MSGAGRLPSPEALAAWLPTRRWYAGKSRTVEAMAVDDTLPLPGAALVIASVDFTGGERHRYALTLREGDAPAEALHDPAAARALLRLIETDGRLAGARGAISGRRSAAFPAALDGDAPVRALGGEQSNTSLAIGEHLALKLFRRLVDGVNPDAEIVRFLTERTAFAHVPRLAGTLDYHGDDGRVSALAIAQELIPGARDGWTWAHAQLEAASRETGAAPGSAGASPAVVPASPAVVPASPAVVPAGLTAVPPAARAMLDSLRRLGQRTGELHRALASDSGDLAFAPQPIGAPDVQAWAAAVRDQLEAARRALGRPLPANVPAIENVLGQALAGVTKIRHHGDFHLGQTLHVASRDDFVIIDFEGEPLRPLAVRRARHAALRDVAGMRRSFGYAAASGAGRAPWRHAWEEAAGRAFTEGYRAATRGAVFVPAAPADLERALAVFEVEKAAYEIVYEAENRPDWLPLPLAGLVSAAARLSAVVSAGAA